ncbi:MAG: 50S ribosomal protein L23 [Candidatus Saccharibacteria bacterium]|nr:50S ribosomal protein L23 [Candidatus Saccharibacteria bacterium]
MKLIPRETEKAYQLATQHTYSFEIRGEHGENFEKPSKQKIAALVAETFAVHPIKVRTIIRKGKPTRFSRGKHAYPGTTFRRNQLIAMVTLPNDETIALFDQAENADPTSEEATKKEVDETAKADVEKALGKKSTPKEEKK